MPLTLVVTNVGLARGPSPSAPQSLTFDQPRIVIGRGGHADVRLPSRAVSDKHAVVHMSAGDLAIVDEGSTNGTTVNGQALVHGRRKVLRPGDRIGVPGFELVVQQTVAAVDPPERTATVARKLLAEALAAVGGEAAPPDLTLTSGRRSGQVWKLPPPPSRLVAGRGEMCEVILDDVDCSRQHAEFVRDRDGVLVRDLGSKNGVLVGGRRVTERRLRDGDEVKLGRSVLRFGDPAEELLRAFEGGADEPAPAAPPPASQPEPLPPAAPAPDGSAAPDAPEAPDAPRAATGGTGRDEAPASGDASGVPPTDGRRRRASRRAGRAADWVVITLAVLILAASVAALYFVLRGAPPPR